MNQFQMISEILGSFGLFFFGLKLISEGVQSIFEKRIKYLMDKQVSGVFEGFLRASFVGLTSVNMRSSRFMALGLLNAGLLPFKDMLTFFLGTALGGSFIFWLLSFGLNTYALNISAVGMLLLLLKVPFALKDVGRALIGVGFILLGQNIIGQFELHYILGPISDWQIQVQLLILFIASTLGHFLLNIPYIVLFLIMSVAGTSEMVLPVHALSLMLGHILGDSLTLYLSLKNAHIHVKRAVFGNVIMSSSFAFVGLILSMIFYGELNPILVHYKLNSPGLFTLVCLLMGLLFFQFSKTIKKATNNIFKLENKKEFPPKLIFFGAGGDVSAALSLMQLELELLKFKNIVDRMFQLAQEYLQEENSPIALAKLKKYEGITDNIHSEIELFVCKLSQSSLSLKQAKASQATLRISSELEKIADYLDKLVTYKTRLTEEQDLSALAKKDLEAFFLEISDFYKLATKSLLAKKIKINDKEIEKLAFSLKKQAEVIRSNHLARVQEGACEASGALIFSDIVVALRKIRGHTHNITQAFFAKESFSD